MDRKTDCDKLQIEGLERNLDQLCTWLTRFCFAAGGEPSSERYFMDEALVTEACSVVSDAENRDPWDLPHVITITGKL